ncbi:MAG: hypothetical protein J5548_13000 [Prevotella sp.]|nr:hypothetical protein [Prevotella sp.]
MKRQYDKQEIAQLLNKFMAGETSLAEEQVLAQYFRTHEVDEEWTEFKEMFTLFDNGEVDIELETETSEHLDNGDSGKIRMLPKTVREKPKIVALKWLGAVAACVLLLLIFHFSQKRVGEKPIVAKVQEVPEVVEQSTPQTDSPTKSQSIAEEKKDKQLAEVQTTSKPAKKQRKAVKRNSAQEKPLLAVAEPKQESAEPKQDGTEPANHPDGQDTTPAFSSPVEDPFLLAASHAQDIRSRGERLHQEIAMLMNNHLMNN